MSLLPHKDYFLGSQNTFAENKAFVPFEAGYAFTLNYAHVLSNLIYQMYFFRIKWKSLFSE